MNLEKLPVVTAEELGRDFEQIIQRLEDGGGPIRIRWEGGSDLLLLHISEYPGWFSLLPATDDSADEKIPDGMDFPVSP